MRVGFSGRPGWSDRVGPFYFLRERWSGGPRWRPTWGRFFAGRAGVTLQEHTRCDSLSVRGVFVDRLLWEDLSYGQKEDFVMSWVKQIRRPDGGPGAGGVVSDPDWVRELPALHEYLTLGTHPDGTVRRTSTLTLFAEHGSWKAWLNERDAGASLCASGPTVADTLAALEVMLEAENCPWRFSDAPKQENGRRPRRGS